MQGASGTGGSGGGDAGDAAGGDASGGDAASGDAGVFDWQSQLPLPDALPFELTRPARGDPLTATEIADFTRKLTSTWKTIDYFRWLTWHAHGLHASYDASMPDYALWWQDTTARKAGDTVTFVHDGGADNLMIRTPKVLSQAVAGYLASGDPLMKELVIGYSKGIVALFRGMHWGNEQPDERIMARALFTHDHAYTTSDGRKVAVDYTLMRGASCSAHTDCPADNNNHAYCPPKLPNADQGGSMCCESGTCVKIDWNAHTVPNTKNPHYGSIWLRNMRSKDDVPHIFRVIPILKRAAEDATDEDVRQAVREAVDYLTGFAKDIYTAGYLIRSKEWGEVFVPVQDLASFVRYDPIFPGAECDAKLTTALLATGSGQDNDCENGISVDYETVAVGTHYYNQAIVQYFHLAAITNALVAKQNDTAKLLLEGLAQRVDEALVNPQRATQPEWDADLAGFLVASAASGLALTAEEARLVVSEYSAAADFYPAWPNYDLWSTAIPDGDYNYIPPRSDGTKPIVRIEELAYFLEYCWSAWKNPASAELVDCSVVLDPARWGT